MTTPQIAKHALMPLAQNSLISVRRTADVRYRRYYLCAVRQSTYSVFKDESVLRRQPSNCGMIRQNDGKKSVTKFFRM